MTNPTAVALLRCSPDGSTRLVSDRLGIEVQRADILRFAAERRIDVISFHVEYVSGGAPIDQRTGLLAASRAIAESGAAHLIVAKRDRLARDPLVALLTEQSLAKVGATVLCADGNNGQSPAEQLMRVILDGVARFERQMISIRTKAALAVLQAGGKKLGRPVGIVGKPRSDKGKPRGPLSKPRKPRLAATFAS
jgi:DNA invertase Pin-like site-specific DNA recombinase